MVTRARAPRQQDQIDSDLLDAQNKREAARRTAQVPTTRRARKYLPVQ
jgi:hypothetical protein